ncbi:hypothetical protein ACFU9B_42355 [Streptomyces sp. NPDC057592]|uniref:hypothetical protein n=1 Tax=unclassified Streptomyces TaxID=2593676 RepID=UPI003681C50B
MTVRIDLTHLMIFGVSCFIGYLVYRHGCRDRLGVPQRGDLAAAVSAGAAAFAALALLIGISGDTSAAPQTTAPAPAATSSDMDGPHPGSAGSVLPSVSAG